MADTAEKVQDDDQDQSMEEILQSIRKIIAEEDDDPKEDAPKPAKAEKAEKADKTEKPAKKEKEAGAPPAGSDVLELTAMVKEDGSVVDVKDAMAAEPEEPKDAEDEARDILQKIDSALAAQEEKPVKAEPAPQAKVEEPKPVPKPEPEVSVDVPETAPMVEEKPAEEPVMTEESLVSEETASAAAASMKELAATKKAKPAAAPKVGAPSFRDGSTVEDLAVEALKPMLKEWLDDNLPSLVEKIIQKEVRRIADKSDE